MFFKLRFKIFLELDTKWQVSLGWSPSRLDICLKVFSSMPRGDAASSFQQWKSSERYQSKIAQFQIGTFEQQFEKMKVSQAVLLLASNASAVQQVIDKTRQLDIELSVDDSSRSGQIIIIHPQYSGKGFQIDSK